MPDISGREPTDKEVEAAAAVIFCHHQFKGDDYTARRVARDALRAAIAVSGQLTEKGE